MPATNPTRLPLLHATRIVRRERSGSSSPVVVETSEGLWLTKLRGAAQGIPPLIAELVVAEIAQSLGLSVPSRALIELPLGIPSDDVNDELRDLLDASAGVNVGLTLLESARNLTRAESPSVSLEVAASTLWLDMFVENLDRSPANPNIMVRRGTYWLIDHGAALPFHHSWQTITEDTPRRPYRVSGHLFGWAEPVLSTVHGELSSRVTRELLAHVVDVIPDALLAHGGADPTRRRAAYAAWLWKRRLWMDEAVLPR